MKKLLIVALLLSVGFASATTRYVLPSGSGITCSQGSPCSPTQGISVTVGGDTLRFQTGTYGCITTNPTTGSSSARVRYISDTPLGAKISCNGLYGWQNGQGGSTRTADYVDIIGFEIQGSTNTCEGISQYGAFAFMQGNYIHDILGQNATTCNTQGGGGIVFRNNGVPATVAHDSVADSNIIDNIGRGDDGTVGDNCQTIHGIYIASPRQTATNNLISRACAWGIHMFHDTYQDVVAGNVIINNYRGGIIVSASDGFTNDFTSVIDNVVAHNGGGGGGSTSAEFGIEERYGPTGTNNVYRNNSLWANLPVSGCNNPPAGVTGCAFNFANGARTVTGTVQTGSDANFFVSYTGNAKTSNLQLKAGSPGIGAGVSGACAGSPGFTTCVPSNDFLGNVWPLSGARDAGAYKFSSGSAPLVNFSPSPLAFGTVAVSTPSTQTATLTNTGTANLTFSAATISGTNASSFTIVSTTCTSPLASGLNCTYTIKATPQAAGALSANLTLNDNASGSPHQLPLTVTGGSASVTFNPTSLSFGVVAVGGTGTAQTTKLTNTGNSNVTVGAETLTNAAEFPFGGIGTCNNGQVLAPGASCTASANFTPTASGARSGALLVTTSISPTPTTISLSGTGGAAVVSLSPSSGSCGSQQVGTSVSCQAFALSNTGNINLTGIVIILTGTNPTSYSQSNTCPANGILAASGGCTITVFFSPTAGGTLTANLSVVSSASSSPNLAPLTGVGVLPTTVTLTPQTFNFGQVFQNTSSSTSFSLTNTGAGAVTITSITTASPFSQTNNCPISPATLAAGLGCVINVTATPTALGTVNGSLTVIDNATGSPHVASMSVTGVVASATLTPSPLAFGNQTVGTPSAAKVETISSGGTSALSGTGQVVLNVDELQPGWKAVCILPSCNPGGSVPPTATAQTFNNATPSKDGKSMLVSITGPAFSNALWVYVAGKLDTATNLVSDFWTQPSPNIGLAGSLEFDQYMFSKTTNTEFMWGTQCNQATNKWQVFDQLNLAWVNVAGSTCPVFSNAFHHIVQSVHRISTDTNSCSGQPCMYYDSIVVDGTPIPGLPMTEPAGPLPSGWTNAVGWQLQLDIGGSGSGGQPVFENVDLMNFTFSSVAITGTNAADFTQTNACGLSIPANSSCGLNVVFKPAGAGSRTATMTFASNDPASPNTASLTGTGIATAPAICVNPSSLNFGNQPVSTTSGALPITVTNCGTANLVVSGVTPTGNFARTTTCGTVTPGATCTISGTFSPVATGALTGQFSIASNAATSPTIITLSGFGTQTGATLTPSSLSFGSVTVGQSSLLTMNLANTGNVSLTVNAPTVSGAGAANFTPGTACTTLAPNATCQEQVTFLPLGAGALSATFNQTFANGVTPVTAALSGTGVATAPAVTLTPSTLDFGNVTTGVLSSVKTVQIQNSGTSLLTFSSITLTGTNSADYTLVSHCGGTLAAGAICTADLSVTPGGTGARTANLHLVDDAASSPQNVTMTVNGVAAPAPRVSLSATTLAFSPPSIQTGTTSGAQGVTATNIGNATLTVTHPIILGGSNPGDYTISDNCGTVLPSASCTAILNCAPTVAGSRTATVPFLSNASSSPDTVTLSCTGFVGTPTLVIAATNINFGNQTVGTTSSPAVFTISNTGLGLATGVVISATGDFTVSDNCSGQVTVGGSCSASVRFNPQVLCGQTDPSDITKCISNIHLGTVQVVSNTSNSPQSVSLEGTAIAATPPQGPITVTMSGQVSVSGNASIH